MLCAQSRSANSVNGATALNPGGMAARTDHGTLQSSSGEAEAQISFNDVFSLRLTSADSLLLLSRSIVVPYIGDTQAMSSLFRPHDPC